MNSSTCDVTRAVVPGAAAGNEEKLGNRSVLTRPFSGLPLVHFQLAFDSFQACL